MQQTISMLLLEQRRALSDEETFRSEYAIDHGEGARCVAPLGLAPGYSEPLTHFFLRLPF